MLLSEDNFKSSLKLRAPVILGCESLTALGILRCLGREGIFCFGIAFADSPGPVCYSKFGKVLLLSDLDSALNLLTDYSAGERKGVLFCATDPSLSFVDRYARSLKQNWHLFASQDYSLEYLMDKSHMIKIAKESGFHVPHTITLSRGQVLTKDVIKSMSYPCIVKPVNSLGPGKDAYEIVTSRDRLLAASQGLLARIPKILIQEYIGNSAPGEVLEAFAFRSQSPPHNTYICTIEKNRIYPYGVGSSSFIKTKALTGLHESITRCLDSIRFNGVVDFEFVQCRGKPFFIEANFRCGTPIAVSQKAGLNLPFLAYLDALGEEITDDSLFRPGVYWLRDNTDWKHILEDRISVWKFVKDVLRTDEFLIFSIDDPRPFTVYLSSSFKHLLSNVR